MSTSMSNINKGGYVPPVFGDGNPPEGNASDVTQPSAPGAYGFVSGQSQSGYMPVPQKPPCGEAPPNYGGQQHPNGGQQPPYGGQQPPYGGEQPPYGGQQPPYGSTAQPQPQPQYNGGGGFQPGPGHGPQGPIVTQPGMPPADCPRGLEYLTMVDQLLVKQKVELLEVFTDIEGNNRFSIKNSLGQNIFYAVEDTDYCMREMCGSSRSFDIRVFDNFRNEVMHVYRALACCSQEAMEVSAPPGNLIGTIEEEPTFFSNSFQIKNHNGEVVLRIKQNSTFTHREFNVVSLSGQTVGKISKQWSGLARELFTDADNFGISFPMDMDVRMKAVLLGATFLIDAMFFED